MSLTLRSTQAPRTCQTSLQSHGANTPRHLSPPYTPHTHTADNPACEHACAPLSRWISSFYLIASSECNETSRGSSLQLDARCQIRMHAPLLLSLAWDKKKKKKCKNFLGRGSPLSPICTWRGCDLRPAPLVVIREGGKKGLQLAGSVVCYCLPILPWLRAYLTARWK